MIFEITWLIKLLLSHLLTDFILQPKSWVEERTRLHFRSPKLYFHGMVTAVVAGMLIGWQHWGVLMFLLFTHIIIDAWKSYQKPGFRYFVIDQLLHMAVILISWYAVFITWHNLAALWAAFNGKIANWSVITAVVFLTVPAGILIGQFTSQWRDKIIHSESLANAGKWIGMFERIIILVFVLNNQYSAIGLLVAAKGIIRFNEKERPEVKTEYLVVGTLLSIGLAIITGLLVNRTTAV